MRKPEADETISVSVWAVANGTHAEIEQAVRVGTVAAIEEEVIRAIYEVRKEVAKLSKSDTLTSALHGTVHRGLEARGCGSYIPGRVGRAIGLGNHERFRLTLALRLVTLEPHIQIPGV